MSESMEELMARDLVRQIDEITALHVRIVRLDRELATLTRERDDARRDAESLADSIEDSIGAQGTAYEPDQYLMLCGVVRDYQDRLDAARTADAESVAPSATDVLFPGAV